MKLDSKLEIRRVAEEDKEFLSECWLRYLKTEPMYSTVGFDVVTDREELLNIFQYNFKPNSPQLALWDADKNMAVGMQLTEILTKSECTGERGWDKAVLPKETKDRITQVEIFAEKVIVDTKILEKFSTDRALLLNGLYIYDEYRGQGYGSKMVEAAVQYGRDMGLKLVSSDLSNFFTQKMFAKLGFQTILSRSFDENLPTYKHMQNELMELHKTFDVVILRLD